MFQYVTIIDIVMAVCVNRSGQ